MWESSESDLFAGKAGDAQPKREDARAVASELTSEDLDQDR